MVWFQEALAAVAGKPELNGLVVAAHTGEYWNHELAALVEMSETNPKTDEFDHDDGMECELLKKVCADYRGHCMKPKEEAPQRGRLELGLPLPRLGKDQVRSLAKPLPRR